MRARPVRRRPGAATVAALAAVLIGVPTGVIPTPFFHRVIPVQWWNCPVTAVAL